MKRRSIFPNSFQFLTILGVSLSSFVSCLSIISPGEEGLMWRPQPKTARI
ncbi:hypothetical protein LEP1GSC017_1640 [Leptospira meyeri serovar Hardjo str. Went 5]|nr:hypothetical protein LEP1GSC017_1640 [Leptospira meyeri serovar Hardjo str. Went 5]